MNDPQPMQIWRIRDRVLDLSCRPLVMGILNVTPDSFSDGGEFFDPERAVAHALAMVEEGADILDVGGESTRPGAEPVDSAEEIRRVVPIIERLSAATSTPISVDTSKGEVARLALAAGAHIVNDISGLRNDGRMASLAAQFGAGLVVMHMKGKPRTMQRAVHYVDLMGEIRSFLADAVATAQKDGVEIESIVVDPGIGFGKRLEHNWHILAHLHELRELGRPILIGSSRKRFLRELVGQERRDLEAATVATAVAACLQGARIVRVHDVAAHVGAMVVLSEIEKSRGADDIRA